MTNRGPPAQTLGDLELHWRSYHHGEICGSKPHSYVVEPIPINRCYPPDIMTTNPHIYSCSLPGGYQFDITRRLYKTTDPTCAAAPVETAQMKRDRSCKKDIETGNYLLSRCGKLSPDVSGDQILIKYYSDAQCTQSRSLFGAGLVKASILGTCLPSYFNSTSSDRDVIEFNRRISFLSFNASTNTTSFLDRRFDKADIKCHTKAIYSATITYNGTVTGSTPPCKEDPLSHGYYTHFVYLTKATLQAWKPPLWFIYPVY